MKAKPFLLTLILLSTLLFNFVPAESELQEEKIATNSSSAQWNLNDAPILQAGWSDNIWQPTSKGALWDIDFSPDGTLPDM